MYQSSSTKITVLCDDRLSSPLFSEHGFSVLIEKRREGSLLFDTGSTNVFIKNAKILGKDLSKVKNIIISHGHYDHAGGLKYLLDFNKKFRVFLREEAFLPKYSDERFTGVDWKSLKNFLDFVIIREEVVKLSDSVYAFGPAPLKNDFEEPDPHFYLVKEGNKVRDFFDEELNLVIDEGDGIVLITGCAHRGIVNIVEYAIEKFNKKLKLLMGGFHLYKAPTHKIERVVGILRRFNIDKIAPYHCSGEEMKRKC